MFENYMNMIRRIVSVVAAGLVLFTACRQNFLPTVEGSVVDATIHSVTVETPEGEFVTVSTLGTNPMLVPGVLPGDEVRIAYELLSDINIFRAVRLDILSPSAYRLLPGIWRDCTDPQEVGLVLAEDGSAQVVGLEGVTLQDWSLDGDDLVLTSVDPDGKASSQTLLYKIERLDIDSLVVRPAEAGRRLSFSRQR